jgi:hypothetical protein
MTLGRSGAVVAPIIAGDPDGGENVNVDDFGNLLRPVAALRCMSAACGTVDPQFCNLTESC